MRQKGRLISTEQFMERIWGYDSDAELNVVWAYLLSAPKAGNGRVQCPHCRPPGAGILIEEIA